jgi:hypothetical protein
MVVMPSRGLARSMPSKKCAQHCMAVPAVKRRNAPMTTYSGDIEKFVVDICWHQGDHGCASRRAACSMVPKRKR